MEASGWSLTPVPQANVWSNSFSSQVVTFGLHPCVRDQYLSPQVQQGVIFLHLTCKEKGVMLRTLFSWGKTTAKKTQPAAGKCSINPVALRWHINLCSTSCHRVEAGIGAIAYPNRFALFCEQQKLSQHLGPPSPLWASCIIISMTREIYFKLKVGWIKARSSINNRIPVPLILKNDWGAVKSKLVKTISAVLLNYWETKPGSFSSFWPGIKCLLFCQICSAGNKTVQLSSDLHQCDCDLYYYQNSIFILLCFCNSHWRASVWVGTVNSTYFEKNLTFLYLKYWWLV